MRHHHYRLHPLYRNLTLIAAAADATATTLMTILPLLSYESSSY